MILIRCLGKLQKIVDQILKKKKDNPNADTGELKKEIDQTVYKLYELNEDKIGI